MIKTTDPVCSSYVYHTLDSIGYNKGMQAYRVQVMNLNAAIVSRAGNRAGKMFHRNLKDLGVVSPAPLNATVLAVGSVSDGIANTMESDKDFMFVFNEVICVDNPTYTTGFVELKPDFSDVSPGYVKLTTANFISEGRMIRKYHLLGRSQSGRPYVSSTLFKDDIKYATDLLPTSAYEGCSEVKQYASGPAATTDGTVQFTALNGVLSIPKIKCQTDCVPAFHFFGTDALKRWAVRKRFYNWPPKSIIDAVAMSNVYVVPVGEVGSETEDIEWRISFIEAEKILITNTNSTQYKLYVLLKMVTNEVIKPVCPSVSSYMVKNVMLWTCERVPSDLFVPTQLIRLTMHALWFFRYSLQNNHLPNYILPERNLIFRRIYGDEKIKLISLLSTLLEENERIILRLPILSEYLPVMRDMPHICTLHGMWRDRGEQFLLKQTLNSASYLEGEHLAKKTFLLDLFWEGMKGDQYLDIGMQFINWICPECVDIFISGRVQEATNLLQERIENIMLVNKKQ